MNEALERQLQESFPFMSSEDSKNVYKGWGCDCADGWFSLIRDMCQEITDRYAKDSIPVDIVVLQVKEKYGGLRFYYSFAGVSEKSVEKEALKQDIAQIVYDYEQKSETICEECGASGIIRTDLCWIQTLCDSCYQHRCHAISKLHKEGDSNDPVSP